MKKRSILSKLSLVGFLFLLSATGCGLASAKDDLSQAKTKITSFLAGSGLKIQSSKYLSGLGFYEFLIDGNRVIYLDKSLKHVFIGDIINIQTKENYTEKRVEQLEVIDFKKLPLDQSIKVVQGNGQVKIAVFTDPDCPFCRKLEKDLKKINDITIYNFLYPVVGLRTPDKAIQIWCQGDDNRARVWLDYIRDNKAIPKVEKCVNPIQKNLILGHKFGIYGTPVIFLPDGRRIGGYIPYNDFIKIISQYRK